MNFWRLRGGCTNIAMCSLRKLTSSLGSIHLTSRSVTPPIIGLVTVTESRSVGETPDHSREEGTEPKFGSMAPNHNFTDYNRKRREEIDEVSSRWVGASLYGCPRYYSGT